MRLPCMLSCGGGEPHDDKHNKEGGEIRAGSFVQPVDKKTILHFFVTVVGEEVFEQVAMTAKDGSGEEDEHERMMEKCFSKCSTFEGIPKCLGFRLSRKLPGGDDYFNIDIRNIHLTAAADARLTEIFALLQSTSKTIFRKQQVLEQLHPSGRIAIAQPTHLGIGLVRAPQVDGISADPSDTDEEKGMAASPTAASGDHPSGNLLIGVFHASLMPYLRYMCAHSGSNLDRHYAHVQSRLYREDHYRIFLAKRLLSAALSVHYLRAIMFIVGLAQFLFQAMPLLKQNVVAHKIGDDYHPDFLLPALRRESWYRGRRVRFTTLAVRDSNISRITSPGVSSFGVMLNGCRLGNGTAGTASDNAFRVSKSFSSITVEFLDVVPFNGWFLITEQGDAALDPSIFAIDTADDDLNWQRVTSSLRADKCGCHKEIPKEINVLSAKQADRLEVTKERGALMKFDFVSYDCLLPVQIIYIGKLGNGLVWMTTTLIAIYVTDFDKWSWVTNLGRSNTHAIDQALRLPMQFASICFFILSTVRIIGLILLHLNDSLYLLPYGDFLTESPEMLLFESLRTILIWPVPVLFSELLNLELFGLSGVLTTVAFFSSGGFSWDGPLVFILACWLYWVREGRRHQQIKAVAEDRVLFKEVWERIMSAEAAQAVPNVRSFRIKDFPLAEDMNEKRLGKFKELLHCNGSVVEHQVTYMREEWMRRELLSDIPVMSLDQLYAQALVMQPFFCRKVQEIASQCNACFHVSPSSDDLPQNIMPWADIECDSATLARVRWDELKHVDRAMYNLAIFHAGDVSKLTDLVRQRIVFQSLSDIHACLKCIAQNEEIEIVSIKNGYDPQSDEAEIAGFREVVVSLRIISKSTIFFCLTRFVCELQLCHVEFDFHLTPARHSRLLRYKDTMYLVHPWKMLRHFTQDQGRNNVSHLESFSVSNQSPLRSRRDSSDLIGRFRDLIGRLSSCRVANSGYVGGNASLPPFDLNACLNEVRGNDKRAVRGQDAPAHRPPSPGLSRNLYTSNSCAERTLTASYQINALSSLLLGDISDRKLRVPVLTADGQSQLPLLVVERVFQVLRFRCEYPGGMLQARIKQWKQAVKGADTTMVMFTRPIGAFTKWPLQIIMCAAAAYMFYNFHYMRVQGTRPEDNPSNDQGMGRNVYRLRHARLTVLETRVPQRLETGTRVGISSLDLLLDGSGCNVMNSGKYLSGDSTREYISFPDTILANGYMITSSLENQSQPRDPRRFHLHFSLPTSSNTTLADCLLQNDWLSDRDQVSSLSNAQQRMMVIRQLRQRGDQWCKEQTCERMRDEDLAMTCISPHLLGKEEWISVSASVCRFATSFQFTCIPRPLDASGYEVGTGRGVMSIFDLRAPWYFVAGNVYPYLILGMGFILIVVFGLCGYIKQTYLTMSLVFVLPGMVEVICGFCFIYDQGNPDGTGDSVFFLMHGFGLCWMGLMMLFAEDYLMSLPPTFWCINVVALYINNQVIVKDIPMEIPSGASFFMAAWIFFVVHRQYLLWRSNKTIETDKRAYQALWHTIISQPDGPQEISDIQAAVDCLGEGVRRRKDEGRENESARERQRQAGCLESSSVQPWERPVQVNAKDESENEVCPFIPGRRQLEEAAVMSVDQLYMQAVILEPIFQDKIKELAAASNGQFKTKLSQNVNLKAWTGLFFQV